MSVRFSRFDDRDGVVQDVRHDEAIAGGVDGQARGHRLVGTAAHVRVVAEIERRQLLGPGVAGLREEMHVVVPAAGDVERLPVRDASAMPLNVLGTVRTCVLTGDAPLTS